MRIKPLEFDAIVSSRRRGVPPRGPRNAERGNKSDRFADRFAGPCFGRQSFRKIVTVTLHSLVGCGRPRCVRYRFPSRIRHAYGTHSTTDYSVTYGHDEFRRQFSFRTVSRFTAAAYDHIFRWLIPSKRNGEWKKIQRFRLVQNVPCRSPGRVIDRN